MLKAITFTSGIFQFTDHLESLLPHNIDPTKDFPLIEYHLKNCLGLDQLPSITISQPGTTQQGLLEKLYDTFMSPGDYTDNESKNIYFRSLSKFLARSVFIDRLAHESVHSIALQLFPNRPDIYLATTIGNWVTHELGHEPGWIGNDTKCIGLGEHSFKNKKLDKHVLYLYNKILGRPLKDAGITESRYGYALGNILFELLQTAEKQSTPRQKIYLFLQGLVAGENLQKSFNSLLSTL